MRRDGDTQCRGAGAGRDRLRHELCRHARVGHGGAVVGTGARDAGAVAAPNLRAADGGTYSLTLRETVYINTLGQADGGAVSFTDARPEFE